jgi:hypothetical protein
MLFTAHSIGGFKKTILYSDFNDLYNKSTNQENSNLFMTSVLQNGKMRIPDKNSNLRSLEFMSRNLDKNAVQEFYLLGVTASCV